MSVTRDDVARIAALARLGLDDDRLDAAVADLNTILRHMDVLSRVDTEGVGELAVGMAGSMPLRVDQGPPLPLARVPGSFAPLLRDGLFLVPRLTTHEDRGDES